MSVTIQPIIRLLAGIAMLTLFSACTEELQPDAGNASDRSRTITFGLSSETETKADSRSGHAAGHYVLRSDTSADSLCLAATVADGVYTDNAIITRGTPVGATNFYDSFRVRGYVDNGTGEADFMDEQLERNGALSDSWKYASDNIYFWPGAGSTFHFYAYAPASLPYADKKIAGYTVPSSATEQQDLMVAATGSLPGDYYRTIGLTFRHICTAVHFSLGYDIRPVTIKSITLKNIRNQGSFDLNASQWTLAETTTDFTLTPNKSTDDTSLPGDAICTPDNTLMMLPQALGDDAQIEVVFQESQNGQEQTLSAPLTGLWTMGIPVRYNISISPDMDLDLDLIVDVSGNTVDAHYVSFPVHIEAAEGVTGTWTLTSDLPDHVTFTDTLTAFQQDNYWVEEDKGTPVFTGTGSKSPVYVYLTENAADTARDIHLTLTGPDGKTITRTVRQLCPAWNGNMGCEQIEEIGETIDGVTKELFPWGFNPEEYTETYTDSKDAFGQNKKYREEIQNTFTELLAGIDYIEIPPNTDKGPVVTINYANAGSRGGNVARRRACQYKRAVHLQRNGFRQPDKSFGRVHSRRHLCEGDNRRKHEH